MTANPNRFTVSITEKVVRLIQVLASSEDEALKKAECIYTSELRKEMADDAPVVHYEVLGSANASRKPGRPKKNVVDIPDVFRVSLPDYLNGTLSLSAFARLCNLSRPTIYKYLRMIKEENT